MAEQPLKRVRYFDHQFLTEDDFRAEQNYHLAARRRHHRLLHTAGVVAGLEVTVDNANRQVTIAPGNALDILGRELLLPDDVPVADRQLTFILEDWGAEQTIWITAVFQADEETDPTPPDVPLPPDILNRNTRFTERRFQLGSLLSNNEPQPTTDNPIVVLGGLQVGDRTSVIPPHFAGARGGDLTAHSLTVDTNATIGQDMTVQRNLSVTTNATVGQDLTVRRDATVQRNLSVTTNATVGQDLTVQRDATVQRNLTVNGNVVTQQSLTVNANATVQQNLGIGGASTGARLQVASAGNAATSYTARFQSSAGVAGAGGILFDQGAANSYKLHTEGTGAADGLLKFSYVTQATGAALNDNVLVLRNGNVGIGTANPNSLLHLSGAATAGLVIERTNAPVGRWQMGTGGDNTGRLDIADLSGPGGVPRLTILNNGNVGIGTNNPVHRLHVAGPFLLVDGAGNERVYIGGDGAGNDVQLGSFNAAITNVALWNATTSARMNLFANDITATRFIGQLVGPKVGYVVDQFVNNLGESLEEGDVIIIGDNQTALYYGANNDVPIPEVDIAQRAGDARVCGIVCEVYGELKPPAPEGSSPGARAKKTTKGRATRKRGLVEPLQPQAFTTEQLAERDRTRVEPGQVGLMVTLGSYAHCKVDADVAPIAVGDLLTTSPTKGHAQKVLDPSQAVGAMVGKALGALAKGKGKIPVLVMLQ